MSVGNFLGSTLCRTIGFLAFSLLLTGCGSSGSGDNGESASVFREDASQAPADTATLMTVSGTVSYDRVPFEGRSYTGLDYDATLVAPARGLTVQAINRSNAIVANAQTDVNGHYEFQVTQRSDIKIRIVAELTSPNGAQWNVQVKDNTIGNALYVLDGSYASTGDNAEQTRDLHAASGWVSNQYAAERSAGPFAILDSIYDAIDLVVSADPNVVLPPLDVFWSPNNIAVNGNLAAGHIGTSFYSGAGPSIYLLGAANNDSDEYDRAVVQHEFGHYLEHHIGRSESIGGSHHMNSKLDIRVAFGEAWGNAFAGMASGDPIYRDSLGNDQSLGFIIDVESNFTYNRGWFSEASIQSILFDLFDGINDSGDDIALGFKPIYDVLTSAEYLNFEGFASIYPFLELLKQDQPEHVAEIAALVNAQNIFGTGMYGDDETNDANSSILLPVYNALSVGAVVNVCSESKFQSYNGIDIRRFVRIDIPTQNNYDISVTRKGGNLNSTRPRMNVYQKGILLPGSNQISNNRLTSSRTLKAGTYILEVYEDGNTDYSNSTGGLACFDVRVD